MFSTLFKLALLAAPALADFAISSPKFTQCKEADISWAKTAGQQSYNLIIVNASNPCGDALADLGDHEGTKISWKVALPAGLEVQLSLEDSNGDEAWSQTIKVADSDDASCVPASLKVAVPEKNDSKPAAVGGSDSTPTVVVTPTYTVGVGASSTPASAGPSAIGAANAGANPFSGSEENGASSFHPSTPVMVLGALAAVFVAAL